MSTNANMQRSEVFLSFELIFPKFEMPFFLCVEGCEGATPPNISSVNFASFGTNYLLVVSSNKVNQKFTTLENHFLHVVLPRLTKFRI